MATAAEAREALVGLTALARGDLEAAWRQVAGLDAVQVRDALMDVLPAIGDDYGLAAAAVAADWYEDVRDEAGAPGYFRADPAEGVTRERWDALARWGVEPLFVAEPSRTAALALLTGGMQRTIADRHRLTIVDNSIRDPAASGWSRVGVGGSCGFCRMLIDRGHVYTEAGVTFRSHDHCNCAATPSFASNVTKVSTEPYRQSKRVRSDATKARDNERAREYIAENYGDN